MAFQFFRRRQKLVLMIMVLLMVAFLIPGTIRGCFDREGFRHVIGYAGGKKITQAELLSAEVDIRILSHRLQMGAGQRPGEMLFVLFEQLNANRQPELAWALLVREAEQMGMAVRREQIQDFLTASGLTGPEYQRLLVELGRSNLTDRHLRRAVRNLLLIVSAFEAAQLRLPPSLPEVRILYRDLRERIELGMVVYPAEDFTEAEARPTVEEIQAWFQERRHLRPDHPSNKTPFGFGYRQPDRAAVAWLLVDQDRLARGVKVPERTLREYWLQHKGTLTREVPVPATGTAPADTQPAAPQTRTVVVEQYSEAKPIIREKLRDEVAEMRASELLDLAKRRIAAHADSPDPYRQAAEELIGDADELLARQVAALPFTQAPLEEVIEQLELLTGVRVVYPYGEHEKLTIEPDVVVELGRLDTPLTLKQVLDRIHGQLKLPRPITWKTCRDVEEAIFPSEPVNLLPIEAGRSGMVELSELATDELLGWAGTAPGGGEPLVAVVASAAVFQGAKPRRTPLIQPGEDFRQAMHVASETRRGRLLWRLVDAQAAHDPQTLTAEIRRDVVRDLKLARAFEKARQAAKNMQAAVQAGGKDLEALAETAGLKYVRSEPFARLQLDPRMGPVPSSVVEVGRSGNFIKQAFDLAPADPNRPDTDGPTDIVLLRRTRKVLLIQRVGYDPPTEAEYQANGLGLAQLLVSAQRRDWGLRWLSYEGTRDRMSYRPEMGGG